MKWMLKLGWIPLVCSLLSGCWNSKEIEHMVYVNGIAIDYIDDKITFWVQVIDFSTIAKKEAGGQPGPGKVWVGKGTGKTIHEAAFDLYNTAPQRIFWGHVNHIVFTESAIKQGLLRETLDMLTRYHEIRPTVWVYGTKTPIENFSTKLIFNLSPLYAKTSDPMDTYRQSSFIRPLQMYRFKVEWQEPGKTVLLLGLSVTDKRWKEDKKALATLEKDGVFLLHHDTYKGWLSHRESLGIRWMQKTSVRIHLAFPEDNPQAVLIMADPKPEIIPILNHGKPKFKIHVAVSGSIGEMKKGLTEREIVNQAAKVIRDEIRKTYDEGLKLQADVFQLSDALYRKNPKVWHQYSVKGEIPLDPDTLQTIEVKIKLISSNKLKINEN